MNKITLFLNAIFSITFVIHTSFIGFKIFYPELPNVRVYKRALKDIYFPLAFRICANQKKTDNEKYKKFGYEYYEDFFRGQSMFNKSLVGWGGHYPNGTNIGKVESTVNLIYFATPVITLFLHQIVLIGNQITVLESAHHQDSKTPTKCLI